MPFRSSYNGVRFYTFDLLDREGVSHAIFTRRGGVSPAPWNSLNVGGTVGDAKERVRENYVRSLKAMGRSPESVFDVWQVHGNRVVASENPRPYGVPHEKADVILTNNPEVTLYMRFADCVPILLYDPVAQAIGLAHAGWQGTVNHAAASAVREMVSCYESDPVNILACIGPSIGAHHYRVGAEVVDQVRISFGKRANHFLLQNNSALHFDLWAANTHLLADAGVTQIEVAGICTACHQDDWFSHRGGRGKTGRFGAMIGLDPQC